MSRRGIAIYAVFILLFGVLCFFAGRFDYFPGDVATSQWLQGIDFTGVKPVMQYAPYAVGLAVLVALRFWLPGRRRAFVFMAITALAAGAIGWLIKELVARPRPAPELVELMAGTQGLSFPSVHAACAAAIGGFLFYLMPRLVERPLATGLVRALLIVIILAVGVSRLYLGAHWASDVMGGLILGGLLLYPAIVLYQKYDAKRRVK